MPVSHDLKCVFVHVPKTGGTSIEHALGLLGDWRQENKATMFGSIESPALESTSHSTRYLQHLSANDLRRLLPAQFATFFRFAFVRNPWDRIVSAYCYLMRAKGTSFNEFLERTEGASHAHLVPQYGYIEDSAGECLVDYVGRFETLASDFAEVCAKLGIRRELPFLNPSWHGPYQGYYDDASRKLVERRYGEDIERFRYTF